MINQTDSKVIFPNLEDEQFWTETKNLTICEHRRCASALENQASFSSMIMKCFSYAFWLVTFRERKSWRWRYTVSILLEKLINWFAKSPEYSRLWRDIEYFLPSAPFLRHSSILAAANLSGKITKIATLRVQPIKFTHYSWLIWSRLK